VEPRASRATRGQNPRPHTTDGTIKTDSKTGTEHEYRNTPVSGKHLMSLVLGPRVPAMAAPPGAGACIDVIVPRPGFPAVSTATISNPLMYPYKILRG
jgi:hypothetical protein